MLYRGLAMEYGWVAEVQRLGWHVFVRWEFWVQLWWVWCCKSTSFRIITWFWSVLQSFTSIPLSELLPDSPNPGILLHPPSDSSILLPLRPGDFNVDGFPDFLFIISDDTKSSESTQVKILENTPCAKGVIGCKKGTKRGWRLGHGKGWYDLEEITDAVGASWLDLDEDVCVFSWEKECDIG